MKIIKNYKNIDSCVLIDSGVEGETVVIFSGIHGNEKSGIFGTNKFFKNLEEKKFILKKGKLIIVFEANGQAVEKNKREIEKNMNRLFRDDLKNRSGYEELRAFDLMNLLKEANYLLDLHSTSGPSIPFIFSEMKNFSFAKKLGVSHIVGGWGELEDGVVSGDTENYINSLGGVGITFEAGNHDNPEGGENAYQMILNFLVALDFLDKKFFKKIGEEKNIFTKIQGVYVAKTNNFKYGINIENFSKIKKQTVIAKDGEEKVYTERNIILILPKEEKIIKKGKEAFFIAEEVK